jgi:hypothetical protein
VGSSSTTATEAASAESTTEHSSVSAQTTTGSQSVPATQSTSSQSTKSAALVSSPVVTEPVAAETVSPPIVTAAAAPSIPWVLQVSGSGGDPYNDAMNYHIAGFFGAVQALITQLPLADPFREALSGTAYTMRRTLLNQAPTVAPLQLTGTSDTAVTGHVAAVDPDGDQIAYHVVQGPASGTLQLNSDGSFTYTPPADFEGVASFVVMAQDLGLHVNVLNPFRGAGSSAGALVNEGAIKFSFNYTTGADSWSTEARDALASSANAITAYFLVTHPVTLTYDVTGENSPTSSTLASAGSDLIGNAPGFWRTVVQNKLISGVDSNGAAADGSISWNFGSDWDYGDSVAADKFDFDAVAMHELMHSFGFLSYTSKPGENTNRYWSILDSFITTSTGAKVIGPDYTWNTAYDPNLIGGNGGLYLAGANAVAGYDGALVPIFTPDPWEEGSSTSHLDDATFNGVSQKLMNAKTDTGPGVRILSPIELGILKDMGYTVVIPSVPV